MPLESHRGRNPISPILGHGISTRSRQGGRSVGRSLFSQLAHSIEEREEVRSEDGDGMYEYQMCFALEKTID